MNLLGFNISISRRSAPESPVSQLSPQALAWLRGEDFSTPSTSLNSAYEQVVWVYRAVNAIAEQIASLPFIFSRGGRGRETLLTRGPLFDFYAQPHPHINAFQYWGLRLLWLLLRGEAIRIPIYEEPPPKSVGTPSPASPYSDDLADRLPIRSFRASPTAKLKHVLLLDPADFQHIIEDHDLIGWRYKGSTNAPLESQVFLPEEVWFDRLPNPFDFWRGLSPLTVATLAAKTDLAASSFMFGLMDSNADAGLIVRSEQQLSDEQREQIVSALRNRRCHAGAANRSLFLWGVNDVIAPKLSSADLQFLENRKLSRSEICAAFGVPEEIVTTTDHNKYDVMQGARLNFIENRIAPICVRLEAMEQVTVKAIDPAATGWFDLDSLPIMQQARRDRLAAAKTGFDMGIPFNELNRILDLGFKPLPWGNTGYLPSTYHPVNSESSSSSFSSSSSGERHAAASKHTLTHPAAPATT